MPENKSIVVADDIPWALLKQTVNIHAKAGLIPRGTTFEQAMVCSALGYQLGIPRFEAMRGIVVVDGKPTLMAGLLQAVVRRSIPTLEVELVEYGRESCTVRGRRQKDHGWTTITFDMEDAKLAGLAGKKNWKQYPKAMLYARASTVLLRMLGADVVHGLYTPDELGAIEDPETGTIQGQAMSAPAAAPCAEPEAETVEVPFTPDPSPTRQEQQSEALSGAEALADRIAKSSEEEASEKSAKETTQDRLRRLGKVLKAEGAFKLQGDAVAAMKVFMQKDPNLSDSDLLDAARAVAGDYNAAHRPATRRRKPAEEKDEEKKSDIPQFIKMTVDALIDEVTKLEDALGATAEGLNARKAAQDASPNWAETEDHRELAVYASNLYRALNPAD